MYGLFYQVVNFPNFDDADKNTLLVADVRNSTLNTVVGFTTSKGFAENLILWPGISPANQAIRKVVFDNGTWTGTSVTQSTGLFSSIFKASLAGKGNFITMPARISKQDPCTTDIRGTDCSIVIYSTSTQLDKNGKPTFAQASAIYGSSISVQLATVAQEIPGSVIVLIEKSTGNLLAGK
jgi:hypothetical protein